MQVQDSTRAEGNDTLTAMEILQFENGFLDLAKGSFSEGYANDQVEALLTSDGFFTNPVPTVPCQPSTAQVVEVLVVESEVNV